MAVESGRREGVRRGEVERRTDVWLEETGRRKEGMEGGMSEAAAGGWECTGLWVAAGLRGGALQRAAVDWGGWRGGENRQTDGWEGEGEEAQSTESCLCPLVGRDGAGVGWAGESGKEGVREQVEQGWVRFPREKTPGKLRASERASQKQGPADVEQRGAKVHREVR